MIDKSTIYDAIVGKNATKFNVPKELIEAICWQESNYHPAAVRYEPGWKYVTKDFTVHAHANHITDKTEYILQSCSWGLMQVMGAVARELGFYGPLQYLCEPELGVKYGTKKLSLLIAKYKTLDDTIAAYNAGSPRRDPVLFRYSNQDYVDQVKARLPASFNLLP